MTYAFETQFQSDGSNDPAKDLDFTGVTSPSRASVPAGIYNAIVKDVELKTGRESGAAYLHVFFSLTDSEVDGTPVQKALSFSDKAKPWSKLNLETILGEQLPSSPFPWPESRDRLIGRLVRLKLAPTEFNGVRDMAVQAILPPTSAPAASGRGSLF